jgi:hypothetical protein
LKELKSRKGPATGTNMLAQLWDIFIIAMVLFFVKSFIEFVVQHRQALRGSWPAAFVPADTVVSDSFAVWKLISRFDVCVCVCCVSGDDRADEATVAKASQEFALRAAVEDALPTPKVSPAVTPSVSGTATPVQLSRTPSRSSSRVSSRAASPAPSAPASRDPSPAPPSAPVRAPSTPVIAAAAAPAAPVPAAEPAAEPAALGASGRKLSRSPSSAKKRTSSRGRREEDAAAAAAAAAVAAAAEDDSDGSAPGMNQRCDATD